MLFSVFVSVFVCGLLFCGVRDRDWSNINVAGPGFFLFRDPGRRSQNLGFSQLEKVPFFGVVFVGSFYIPGMLV